MWTLATLAMAGEPLSPAPVPSTQARLYVEANTAYEDGRYDVALDLLAEAEQFGARNLIHLARGRVLQRLGRCEDADRQYLLALTAPPVPSPLPAAVEAQVALYRNELRLGCPATVEVRCTPPNATLEVDGVRGPCGTFSLPPGLHQLELSLGRSTIAQHVELRGLERRTVELEVDPPRGRPLAIAALGAGAALFATGALLDLVWLGPSQDRQDLATLSGDPMAPVYRRRAETLRWTALAG